MAITRSQQAKQLLAQGGRTGFFLGGGGGADYDIGGGGNPNRTSTTSSTNREKGIMSRGGGEGGTTKSIKDFKETGPDRSAVDTGSKYKKNVNLIKQFERTRPDVKTPPLGVLSFFKKPLQKFSDFTTARNRKFFEDVIRAGKIPGLNFATLSDLTPQQLENTYQDYMSDRLAGNIDAYGNPLYSGNDNEGITSMYNPNMFVDDGVVDDNASTDLFVSRFLQNQPDQIRQDIEEQMQNYYTV